MKRDKWLQIPVNSDEHRRAKIEAQQYGISVSELIRRLLIYSSDVRPQLTIVPKSDSINTANVKRQNHDN
jgi:hypothetical protein